MTEFTELSTRFLETFYAGKGSCAPATSKT